MLTLSVCLDSRIWGWIRGCVLGIWTMRAWTGRREVPHANVILCIIAGQAQLEYSRVLIRTRLQSVENDNCE